MAAALAEPLQKLGFANARKALLHEPAFDPLHIASVHERRAPNRSGLIKSIGGQAAVIWCD
jgi:hypothetical protein